MTSWSRPARNDSGSVLIESTFSVFLVLSLLFFSVEVTRRAQIQWGVQCALFLFNRGHGFNGDGYRGILPKSKLERAFGAELARPFFARMRVERTRKVNGVETKVYLRFPSLLRFSYGGGMKHHFEVTRKCLFPSF